MKPIRPPSMQGKFALVYSGDPSLHARPENLPDSASDAERTDRANAQAKHDHDLKVCGELGNWSAMARAGESPAVFRFELPTGQARSSLEEFLQTGHYNGDQVLWIPRLSIMFRAMLRGVSNFGDYAVKLSHDGALGIDLAQQAIVDDLLDVGRYLGVGDGVLVEFATSLIAKLREPIPGK